MQTNFKSNLVKIVISSFLIFITVLLFINPKHYINSVSVGLSVWATAVLPSLLPFFIITKSFSAINIIPFKNRFFSLLSKLFKVPSCGIYIFIMSVISGYPVGAKLIEEFYKIGCLNEKQATKLVAICSTSGPLFIVGTVGIMFLGSIKLGFILLIAHIVGVILNGILYRNCITTNLMFENLSKTTNKNANILYDIMINSILSVLVVGGYISIFFMIIDMLSFCNITVVLNEILHKILFRFGIEKEATMSFFNGLIEVTNGCNSLSLLSLSNVKKVVISSLLIGFGGCCVHMQSLTFLLSSKVNLKFYFLSKTTQSILSGICAYYLALIFVV